MTQIEALAFYADPDNWKEHETGMGMMPGDAEMDSGNRARDALAAVTWTPDYPTTPGPYWFFGWADAVFCRKNEVKPRLVLANVVRTGQGVTAYADGQFLYDSAVHGLWMPAELPAAPENLFADLTS